MLYDYKTHAMFENLIGINKQGRPDLFICTDGKDSNVVGPSDNEPATVYHYCKFESFEKILSSKSIWLTDLFCTNDYKEVVWFLEQFQKYADSLNLTNVQHIQKIKLLQLIFQLNLISAFSSSYTVLKDSLGQWRGYGDDGCGVAIGINPCLLKITRDLPERHTEGECVNTALAFIQVNYDEDYQMQLLKSIIDDVLAEKMKIFSAGFSLAKIAYTCKNSGWSEENEWRILYTPIRCPVNLILDQHIDSIISPIREIRNSNNKIVNYAELKLVDNLICEIIIGPKCNVAEDKIKQILQKSFDNVDGIRITKSNITYR